ncbi:uncharacterized protein LACBIDRAFT_315411 [Laccaria bicolor S238N-H82]|uniref:Predicted protein n=1 Tax=Laccaria bicolor (strain S238N-H82 / ATCC MYA-4686) TaxID=486041 RepID=B0D2B8_LACBS|nr:uncharacterized protein LACBIDRAFT_315411 [Laccaria bicolor S238N-H82]EDR10717.1 predicted protein [Laccaria bicolor S238N-H82]|eukprot:XP_001878018.1 predicted protein [Laccaria bicolor S238N-H82]
MRNSEYHNHFIQVFSYQISFYQLQQTDKREDERGNDNAKSGRAIQCVNAARRAQGYRQRADTLLGCEEWAKVTQIVSKYSAFRMEPRSVSRVPVFRTEIRRLDEQWRRLGGYGGVNGVRTRYTIKIRNHSLGSLKKQTSTRGKVTQILGTSHGATFWVACTSFTDGDTSSRGFKRAMALFWGRQRSQDTLNHEVAHSLSRKTSKVNVYTWGGESNPFQVLDTSHGAFWIRALTLSTPQTSPLLIQSAETTYLDPKERNTPSDKGKRLHENSSVPTTNNNRVMSTTQIDPCGAWDGEERIYTRPVDARMKDSYRRPRTSHRPSLETRCKYTPLTFFEHLYKSST